MLWSAFAAWVIVDRSGPIVPLAPAGAKVWHLRSFQRWPRSVTTRAIRATPWRSIPHVGGGIIRVGTRYDHDPNASEPLAFHYEVGSRIERSGEGTAMIRATCSRPRPTRRRAPERGRVLQLRNDRGGLVDAQAAVVAPLIVRPPPMEVARQAGRAERGRGHRRSSRPRRSEGHRRPPAAPSCGAAALRTADCRA